MRILGNWESTVLVPTSEKVTRVWIKPNNGGAAPFIMLVQYYLHDQIRDEMEEKSNTYKVLEEYFTLTYKYIHVGHVQNLRQLQCLY